MASPLSCLPTLVPQVRFLCITTHSSVLYAHTAFTAIAPILSGFPTGHPDVLPWNPKHVCLHYATDVWTQPVCKLFLLLNYNTYPDKIYIQIKVLCEKFKPLSIETLYRIVWFSGTMTMLARWFRWKPEFKSTQLMEQARSQAQLICALGRETQGLLGPAEC